VLFGWLSDLLGSRRIPFVMGLGLLAAASIGFALAPNMPVLLVARTFQGLATAIVFTIGYTLLLDKVGSKRLGRALGYTSMSMSVGWFLGPVVGGIVYVRLGYLAVFVPALALIAAEIGLRLMIIDDDRSATPDSHPEAVSNAGSEADENGETTPLVNKPPTQAQSPSKSAAFLTLVRSPRLIVAVTAQCIFNGLMVSFDSVLPVFIKDTFDYDSFQVALIFLCLLLPMMLCPLFGTLTDRVGIKWVTFSAFALIIPTLILLREVDDNSHSSLLTLIGLLFFLGTSFALGTPALGLEIAHTVEEVERDNPGIFGPYGASAQAYGISNAVQGLGMTIGPIGAGFLRIEYGWPVMTAVCAAVSVVGLIMILPITGGKLFQRRNE
jgi:MFS family permease